MDEWTRGCHSADESRLGWPCLESAPATSHERRADFINPFRITLRHPPTLISTPVRKNNNHLGHRSCGNLHSGLVFQKFKLAKLGWKWLNWSSNIRSAGTANIFSTARTIIAWCCKLRCGSILSKQDVFSTKTSQAIGRSAPLAFLTPRQRLWLTRTWEPTMGLWSPSEFCRIWRLSSHVQAAARAFLRNKSAFRCVGWNVIMVRIESGRARCWFKRVPHWKPAWTNSWAYLRASHSRAVFRTSTNWVWISGGADWTSRKMLAHILYNATPPWDNPLVTTRVHNTVTVDGTIKWHAQGASLCSIGQVLIQKT